MNGSDFVPPRLVAGAASLLVANTVPLVGLAVWGWSAFDVLVLYWLESAVIGLLTLPRILLARGVGESVVASVLFGVSAYQGPGAGGPGERIGLTLGFVVMYGFLWLAHGVFLFVFPTMSFGDAAWFPGVSVATFALLVPAAGAMVLSHGVSFVVNYLAGGEFRRRSPMQATFTPLTRAVVLHYAVLVGGIAMVVYDTPLWSVVLLVVGKTVLDLVAHLAEHVPLAYR
ncbi:DUF6498-containing protein [Halosegnis marinus]|uniref:DUF6498-containing protein n=1 Tax=Halosegnis marinus TaxID=3034023 RepID=A0ABD5ZKX9_9EURY|nr:DUF6498-containing protein [Halosegnis sp. DT85]